MHRFELAKVILVLAALTCLVGTAAAQGRSPSRQSVSDIVNGQVQATLDALQADGDFEKAELALSDLFDRVIAHASPKEPLAFHRPAAALRLVRQLGAADASIRLPLLAYLRENQNLANVLVFLVKPVEDSAKVYAMLDRLREVRGDKLDAFAPLAAAICVVHDVPMHIHVNENHPKSIDPVDIFDFYVRFEKQMRYGVRDVPAELLVFVVDTTATADEMAWAVQRYAGEPEVGRLYSTIEYDTDHFLKGTPKKSTAAGWGLRNILQYGGVCADQAYFAMTVGKSIGVPTTYNVGVGADLAHAWVGYLRSNGRRVAWDFNTGRYEAYQGVKGSVTDPQTRRSIPDSQISLLAEMSMVKAPDRHAAAAMVDAALRVREIDVERISTFDPEPFPEGTRGVLRAPRAIGVETELDLIESGLRRCPGYAPGWFAMRNVAMRGDMSPKEMQKWAQTLDRLCGGRFPDFSLAVLGPMIASVEDIKAQNRLWNRAFDSFKSRHDLAAEVRLAQARMWREAGEPVRAGKCYEEIIVRYVNAGPFVLKALQQAEQLLRDSGREDRIPALYAETWSRAKKPQDGSAQFLRGGVWYRIGMAYAAKLEEAGMSQQAAAVRSQIAAR